jgi:hypothetical protein
MRAMIAPRIAVRSQAQAVQQGRKLQLRHRPQPLAITNTRTRGLPVANSSCAIAHSPTDSTPTERGRLKISESTSMVSTFAGAAGLGPASGVGASGVGDGAGS